MCTERPKDVKSERLVQGRDTEDRVRKSTLCLTRVLQGEQRENGAVAILGKIMAEGLLEIIIGANPYIQETGWI